MRAGASLVSFIRELLREQGYCIGTLKVYTHEDAVEPFGNLSVVAWRKFVDAVEGIRLDVWFRGENITYFFMGKKKVLPDHPVLSGGDVVCIQGSEKITERLTIKQLESLLPVFPQGEVGRGLLFVNEWFKLVSSPCVYSPAVELPLRILLEL